MTYETIEDLINYASKIGNIRIEKFMLIYTGEDSDVEEEEKVEEGVTYVIHHKGTVTTSKDIRILTVGKYKFLWIKNVDNKSYIYFADNIDNLIVDSGNFDDVGGISIYNINLEDRKFCIELTTNEFNFFYINYITTLPEGCLNIACKRTKGLFQVLYILLSSINYTDNVSLQDDVQIDDVFITPQRALQGKENISMYQRYGFKMSPDRRADIIKLANTINNTVNNHEQRNKLNKITRAIPMVATNISKFNQCM